MTGLKKGLSALLLLVGVSILVVATDKLQNRDTPLQDREELKACIVLLGIPFTVSGGLMAWKCRSDRTRWLQVQAQQERDRIQWIFYQLLKANKGRMFVMSLAMEAGLSRKDAQQFLDEKALEFDAHFEVSDRGEIFYYFNIGQLPEKM